MLAYKSSLTSRWNGTSDIYPTLEIALQALEVERFRSSLEYKIFALSPVQGPPENLPSAADLDAVVAAEQEVAR